MDCAGAGFLARLIAHLGVGQVVVTAVSSPVRFLLRLVHLDDLLVARPPV